MLVTFKVRRWPEEDLAKRLCRLLYGTDEVRKEDQPGGTRRWHIGTNNDAWLHPKDDDVFVLHYRYGTPGLERALAAVIEWRLHVEILPNTP